MWPDSAVNHSGGDRPYVGWLRISFFIIGLCLVTVTRISPLPPSLVHFQFVTFFHIIFSFRSSRARFLAVGPLLGSCSGKILGFLLTHHFSLLQLISPWNRFPGFRPDSGLEELYPVGTPFILFLDSVNLLYYRVYL